MKKLTTSRRRFLVASIAFSGLATGTLGPAVLRLSSAWAQSPEELDQSTRDAMVRMARLLYPHDAISDDVYAEILDEALSATAADDSFGELLRAAEYALNAQQPADFVTLDEADPLKVLTSSRRFAARSANGFTTIRRSGRSWAMKDPRTSWAVT